MILSPKALACVSVGSSEDDCYHNKPASFTDLNLQVFHIAIRLSILKADHLQANKWEF